MHTNEMQKRSFRSHIKMVIRGYDNLLVLRSLNAYKLTLLRTLAENMGHLTFFVNK